MAVKPDFDGLDARLLQHCRPVWVDKILIAIARNHDECVALAGLVKTGDLLLEPENFPGPIVVVRDFGDAADKELISLGRNI